MPSPESSARRHPLYIVSASLWTRSSRVRASDMPSPSRPTIRKSRAGTSSMKDMRSPSSGWERSRNCFTTSPRCLIHFATLFSYFFTIALYYRSILEVVVKEHQPSTVYIFSGSKNPIVTTSLSDTEDDAVMGSVAAQYLSELGIPYDYLPPHESDGPHEPCHESLPRGSSSWFGCLTGFGGPENKVIGDMRSHQCFQYLQISSNQRFTLSGLWESLQNCSGHYGEDSRCPLVWLHRDAGVCSRKNRSSFSGARRWMRSTSSGYSRTGAGDIDG